MILGAFSGLSCLYGEPQYRPLENTAPAKESFQKCALTLQDTFPSSSSLLEDSCVCVVLATRWRLERPTGQAAAGAHALGGPGWVRVSLVGVDTLGA
jgi:hypothetical protein